MLTHHSVGNRKTTTNIPCVPIFQEFLKFIGLGLIVLVCASCSFPFNSDETVENTPGPDALFDKAQGYFKDAEYDQAIHFFETLKSAYPTFPEISVVQSRIADSYYRMGEYPKAMAEYKQFLTLYPTDPNVPRAKYMIGMCYYEQKKSIDRDDSVVRRAEEVFKGVAQEYKGTDIGEKAEKRLLDCRKHLAAKELYKANVYMSIKKYKAAKWAAERILEEYGGLGYDDEAKAIIESVDED